MDRQRRNRYLRALDIGVWTRADAPHGHETESASIAPASSSTAPQDAVRASAPMPADSNLKQAAQQRAQQRVSVDVTQPKQSAPPLPLTPQIDVPKDWPGLQAAVAGCTRCKLCRTRNNTVFGVGAERASLMVIGEGPGADEDAQGFPFVGRAGKLLDEMLKAIGRSRAETDAAKSVYIANVVKCRPPANRDPEADEVAACRPYLDAQIEHVKPKLIVALGRIAAQRLLSSDEPLSKLRGPQHEYGERKTPVLITYHPAYLLRSPGEKAKSWADLKRVSRFLAGE